MTLGSIEDWRIVLKTKDAQTAYCVPKLRITHKRIRYLYKLRARRIYYYHRVASGDSNGHGIPMASLPGKIASLFVSSYVRAPIPDCLFLGYMLSIPFCSLISSWPKPHNTFINTLWS